MSFDDADSTPDPQPMSDAWLMDRIALRSDRHALAALYRRHGTTLYANAFGIVFNSRLAENAVRWALRQAWRRAVAFDAGSRSVASWLAELTRKRARDLRKALSSGLGPAPHPARAPSSEEMISEYP